MIGIAAPNATPAVTPVALAIAAPPSAAEPTAAPATVNDVPTNAAVARPPTAPTAAPVVLLTRFFLLASEKVNCSILAPARYAREGAALSGQVAKKPLFGSIGSSSTPV